MIRFRKSLPFPLFKVFLWHLVKIVKIEFWMIFLIHFKKLPINKAFVQKTPWIRKLHLSWGNKVHASIFTFHVLLLFLSANRKWFMKHLSSGNYLWSIFIRKWFMNKSKLWEFHTLSFQISAALLCPPVRHSWNKTENVVICPNRCPLGSWYHICAFPLK